MEGGRYSVDLGNLQRNRRNEIGRKKSRKGKELAGSSSQSRDDFETGYQRRDGDAMSEEQLQQELARHNNRFLQQQQMPTTIDEEELEDEDAEELEPETAEEEGAGSHDADALASSQTATGNKKGKSELMKNNFDKWKDPQTGYWHATCKWCNDNYSLGTSGGYGSAARHLKAKHPVEYAKLGGGTGKQTQISRLANLEDCFNFYYLAFFGEFPMYDDNPIDPKTEYNEVSTLFYALFNEFRAQYSNAPPPPSRTSSSKGKSIFKSAFGNLMKKTKTTHVTEQSALNEITLYLTYEVDFEENDDFDVLDWWKSKERTFPILARMAKQVLSMPVSTIAVEQEFSSAGNVLTASRSRLSAESLETLICYHDWLKAARRTQELSITPSQDFMDDSTIDGGSTYAGDSD
ncbi:unnamed protein product [Cuscuta epithymum]|uniref:HAT C-terminal dimerisation domain-containing protein n=1 Tax=Cuscuta epithymum TaxID=186058 RepID=A0AAV0CBG5_9ASTE|nr:unnamed protein product [Cuscuta epithymum]